MHVRKLIRKYFKLWVPFATRGGIKKQITIKFFLTNFFTASNSEYICLNTSYRCGNTISFDKIVSPYTLLPIETICELTGLMFRLITSSSSTLWRYQRAGRSIRWSTSTSAASTTASSIFDKVTFIGTGKMAQAMIDPLISNGFQPAEKVAVYDVSTKSMENIKSRFPDIQTSESIAEAVHEAECIVLAVKPQNVNEDFWKEFPSSKVDNDDSMFNLREDASLVSILAGTPVKDFAPSGISKIVRRLV